MKPVQSAKKNLKSFENIISSIADGSFDDEVSVLLLQMKCKNVRMEAEIYMALYPDSIWPCLKLYDMRIAQYLDLIKELQENCFPANWEGPDSPLSRTEKRLMLQRLEVVYSKLDGLGKVIKELLQ